MSDWQPIETAPKDGHKIDLWITAPKGALTTDGYSRVSDCWFSDGRWWVYDETKYASDSANCRSEVWNVTHWMPRPTPPLSSTQCACIRGGFPLGSCVKCDAPQYAADVGGVKEP